MRLKPPKVPPSADSLEANFIVGPTVPEGTYTAKLIDGKDTYTSEIKLVADPRLQHSADDRKMQQETAMKLYRMQQTLGYYAETAEQVAAQAKDRAGKLKKNDSLAKSLNTFATKVENLRKTLVATRPGYLTGEEQLKEKMLEVYLGLILYNGRPTDSQIARMAVLQKELDQASSSFDAMMNKDLNTLNNNLKSKKLDPITFTSREDYDKKESRS